ncbi:copper homeostasis protein CutC [Frigidibacter sp. RF13]|uniref:copper homeostasis protein CutC n=1 Tax=Frigidibacter sp. RF13 TaxID=2997340 RepID=UPI00226FB080|nr:copper homeostasis protein CutC [Frigidibacter sp. RF13]MCY1128665.1 copper homeostasis protein CutC [Frigidibacter sp. RF13]
MAARVVLEVCVETPAGIEAAIEGGADRIELCAALALGGLTPSASLMAFAGRAGVPVTALIRPRAGGFGYDRAELQLIADDIARARDAGLAGVTIGAGGPEGLDIAAMELLTRAAEGLTVTLHRVFDLVEDKARALETARAVGVARILTSGGATSAARGSVTLAALVRQAVGSPGILAAGGIRAENARALLEATGVREVHASCGCAAPATATELAFGFASANQRMTDPVAVRALRAALDRS